MVSSFELWFERPRVVSRFRTSFEFPIEVRAVSHSYRDLLVWQKSMGLVKLIYQETRSFPHEEMFGLTSQMRRAAV